MKYTFNGERVHQYMTANHLSLNRMMKETRKTNNVTVAKWRDGEVMRGEDILIFCNVYDVNPAEFFLEHGQPLLDRYKRISHDCESNERIANNTLQQQMAFIVERTELEKKHAHEISDLEKAHLRELMQKEIDFAHREADFRETIRREIREEYEEQIRDLRSQLMNLTTQYCKVEPLTGTNRVTTVAE